MDVTIAIRGKRHWVDLDHPLGIAPPLTRNGRHARAFGLPRTRSDAILSVSQGGSCNCERITLVPHTVTHTECYGHIAKRRIAIGDCLTRFHFLARLISLKPADRHGDRVILAGQIRRAMADDHPEALIIRTLPNTKAKLTADYTGKNPPWIHPEAAALLASSGVRHLLVDLPSIDKENDRNLPSHRAFWKSQRDGTITELIVVPNFIPDGRYLLNLQIIRLDSDASPSNPILFRIQK